MANDWLRLWHDMPTDPKWRVIARASKQPLSLVIALYTTLLVDASKNKSRGVTKCHDEDLAVTLDCDIEQIQAIKQAMQGRVLDGEKLTGWETRQPKKEDSGNQETGAKSAAERKAAQRDIERMLCENAERTLCHDESRNVTTDTEEDTDKSKHLTNPNGLVVASKPATIICPHNKVIELYGNRLPELPFPRIWEGKRQQNLASRWRWVLTAKKQDGSRYATDTESALSFFDRYFAYVAKSDFLTGRDGKWAGCDLGWLVKAENFAKVISGNYENKEAA